MQVDSTSMQLYFLLTYLQTCCNEVSRQVYLKLQRLHRVGNNTSTRHKFFYIHAYLDTYSLQVHLCWLFNQTNFNFLKNIAVKKQVILHISSDDLNAIFKMLLCCCFFKIIIQVGYLLKRSDKYKKKLNFLTASPFNFLSLWQFLTFQQRYVKETGYPSYIVFSYTILIHCV